jgi:methyl-accepting chemotaxis protein
MAEHVKRKQFIVDRQNQFKVLAVVAIYMAIAVLLTGLLMFLPSFLRLSGSAGVDQYNAAREVLVLHKRFWPAVLIAVVVLGGHSIFMFHRLFGPLYRFKETMREITRGDLSFNIRLRKKDFLKEEEQVVNNMIDSLRQKIGTVKEENMLVFEALARLAADLEQEDMNSQQLKERIAEIRRREEKIADGLDSFKINSL